MVKTKRYIILLLICAILLPCVWTIKANATEVELANVVYMSDGSYYIETVFVANTKAMGQKSGTKVAEYFNSQNVLQWKAEVHGDFTYTGTVAICTNSTCDVTIYNSNCFVDKNLPYISANRACADVCIGYRILGITIRKDSYDIRLTCDVDGNLS